MIKICLFSDDIEDNSDYGDDSDWDTDEYDSYADSYDSYGTNDNDDSDNINEDYATFDSIPYDEDMDDTIDDMAGDNVGSYDYPIDMIPNDTNNQRPLNRSPVNGQPYDSVQENCEIEEGISVKVTKI